MLSNQPVNKDLILREKLALQRTILANQSTFLAFLKTSMYFMIAGLSIDPLLSVKNAWIYEILLFTISAGVLVIGVINYFRQKRKIHQSEIHIGRFRDEYQHD